MKRAMASQAEADRERRAKVINAEASSSPLTSSRSGGHQPQAQRATARYLQPLLEIGVDQNSTIVSALPIDLIEPLLDRAQRTPARRRVTTATVDRLRRDHDEPALGAECVELKGASRSPGPSRS